VRVRCAPASGSRFPLGSTEVRCTAKDAAGNRTAVAFLVTVTDRTPPQIDGIGDIVADATDAAGATVGFAVPTAWDNVDGAVAVGCDWVPGALFPVGTTAVTCAAQDAAGNQATPVSFAVTVNPPSVPAPTELPTPADASASAETVVPIDTPTEAPREGPTPPPTTGPEPTQLAIEDPADEPAATETPEPVETAAPTEAPTDTPTDEPDASATPAPSEEPAKPTEEPTEEPTKEPTATTTPKADGETSDPRTGPTPEALGVDEALLGSFAIVTDGGPLGVLTSVWGGLDFPISQEFGHTEFSVTHHSWYAYGADYGLDGYEHPGIDIGMPRGTALFSPVDGVVKVAGGTPYYTFYGNGQPGVGELLIEASDGNQVVLGHMGRIVVEAGQTVKAGQFVGLSGGDNGDHLHLEARERQPLGGYLIVDPRKSFLVPALKAAADAAERTAEEGGAPRERPTG
jgi:murein DD-endopeptidase MepM/ murein hydrolase activator NlpD